MARKKPELRIRVRRKCAEGDEKFYELARRAAGGWFELHQLKKAVPQKFHNAASRRDTTRGGGGGKKRESTRHVKCPSSFAAFPRGGKALLFVRAPFCRATDNDRLPRLRHQSQLIRTRCPNLLLIDARGC